MKRQRLILMFHVDKFGLNRLAVDGTCHVDVWAYLTSAVMLLKGVTDSACSGCKRVCLLHK